MAAYAPLPGGPQTACAFKTGHNDSRDSVSLHEQQQQLRRSRLKRASVCQQLMVRHDVGRTGAEDVHSPEFSLSGSVNTKINNKCKQEEHKHETYLFSSVI